MGNNKILHDMYKELSKADSIYHPSDFWIRLGGIHREQLTAASFRNFKRSINIKYFNWSILGILVHQGHLIINQMKRGNWGPILKSNFINYRSKPYVKVYKFNPISAFIYKIFVASYMDYLLGIDKQNILQKIGEPIIGNPFLISYKNKKVSQDLCNSIHEFYSITDSLGKIKNLQILEIGAGYGRLAYIFLNQLQNCSYCIIDIPPALFVAQKYLSSVFLKEKIFKFRPFSSYEEIKKEFEESRIRFLMPHQMELLPRKKFDLFISISSLHEMTREQIKNYLNQIDRICKGYFYTKQWRKSRTMDNNFIKEKEYPIPKNWKVVFKRDRHPIQTMFFDAIYKI